MRILKTEVDPSKIVTFLQSLMSLKENDPLRTNVSSMLASEKWGEIMLTFRESEGTDEGIDMSVD